MNETQFPPGTPVCVRQVVEHRIQDIETEVVGVVEAWTDEPTRALHAHGKQHKLWLKRLKLRKSDGELVVLVVDDGTSIAKLEPRSADEKR